MNKALVCTILVLLQACARRGGIENAVILLGPGVRLESGSVVGWDGVTTIPSPVFDDIVQAMGDQDTVAVREVYRRNTEILPQPKFTGYITYDGERSELLFYRDWDGTGYFLQFYSGIVSVGNQETLHVSLYENRISPEEPVVDLDLGVNWRDCRWADDTGDTSWFYYEETDYRLLWYSVFCVWPK